MLKLKSKVAVEKLVLGDYVAVHTWRVEGSQLHLDAPHDIQEQREEFFQRVLKERGTLSGERHKGSALISMASRMINTGNKSRGVLQNSLLRSRTGNG